MDSRTRRFSEPRCPEWCRERDYPGLPEFLQYYGDPLPSGDAQPFQAYFPPSHSPGYALVRPQIASSSCDLPRRPSSTSLPSSTSPINSPSALSIRFAPKVLHLFEPREGIGATFECSLCGGPSTLSREGSTSSCGHYVPCKECQTRVVNQLLRCGSCCRFYTGTYPVASLRQFCRTTAHGRLSSLWRQTSERYMWAAMH